MQKPELLAPAGSLEKAKTAFKYGADAVYMGTSNLSLRSRVTVDDDELIKTIEYAHSINKKVYAALNIYARDNMYEEIENQNYIVEESTYTNGILKIVLGDAFDSSLKYNFTFQKA